MKCNKSVLLKDGSSCLLRNVTGSDAGDVLEIFNKTHEETDFLLTYPDENTFTVEEEAAFLAKKTNSPGEIEIGAIVHGKLAGLAGISAIGAQEKIRHRAEMGISIAKEFWGRGIGRALTEACIACAKAAGYRQLELEVVAENSTAIGLYKSFGFEEYGRNPRGFCSRHTGWQTLVLMRLYLD